MKINVKVNKLITDKDSKVKAIVSVTLDNAYAIHNIRILESATNSGTYFLAMPSVKKKNKDDYFELFHPVSAEARKELVDEVLKTYETCLSARENAEAEKKSPKRRLNSHNDTLPLSTARRKPRQAYS